LALKFDFVPILHPSLNIKAGTHTSKLGWKTHCMETGPELHPRDRSPADQHGKCYSRSQVPATSSCSCRTGAHQCTIAGSSRDLVTFHSAGIIAACCRFGSGSKESHHGKIIKGAGVLGCGEETKTKSWRVRDINVRYGQ
jgi:hypothetical protein